MAHIGQVPQADVSVSQSPVAQRKPSSPAPGRVVLLALVAAGALAGVLLTNEAAAQLAIAQAGPDLTRLLRAMAGMKALAAAGLVAAMLWRLAAPVSWGWLAGYALAGAAMAAGPGLIWDMAHLRLGALLLHGGLLATVVLLWRDPVMHVRLEQAVARRRAVLKARPGGSAPCTPAGPSRPQTPASP